MFPDTVAQFVRVGQSVAWKLLKPHMLSVVQDVLFPLMCYSDADQELWNSDPYEYVRVKFGKWGSLSVSLFLGGGVSSEGTRKTANYCKLCLCETPELTVCFVKLINISPCFQV